MAQQYDLIIVGAGMVGAALALAMADTSLKVAVLDVMPLDRLPQGQQTASGFDPRVSALSVASERTLEKLKVWQRIDGQARSAYRYMRVWDAEGTGEIHFDAYDLSENRLGHIVENYRVQRALLEVLGETSVTLLGGRRVEGLVREQQGWRLSLVDGERLFAPLIVAADGARSKLRELAGFPMREWGYLHDAIVTTVQISQPHQDTAWQRFLPTGPLAFLPLPSVQGRHYCSIVWSLVPVEAQRIMELEDSAFAQALAEAIEGRLGVVLAVDTRQRIALRQRHARHYAMEGLVLIGDAAHSIHPLAGQGVNLGFLDAAELSGALHTALQRGECFSDLAVLQRFERRRIGANLGMMAAMEGFERLFHADALPVRWLRNAGMQWLDRQDLLKSAVMRRAMGLSGTLPPLAQNPYQHSDTDTD